MKYFIPAILLMCMPFPLLAQEALFTGTIDAVNENIITNVGQSFTGVLYDVLEITSGAAAGKRFMITDYESETLFCETGLLDSYTTSIQDAGANQGDTYSVLETNQLATGTGWWNDAFSIQDSEVAWPENYYQSEYLYLAGTDLITEEFTESLFEITRNTSNTLFVGQTLPPYNIVSYIILTDPSSIIPQQENPTLHLASETVLTAEGILRSLTCTVTPGKRFALNEVDPYFAVLDPIGRLLFLKNGRWQLRAEPVFEGFYIGSEFTAGLGVYLMGPDMLKGRYTVYGVLNTPRASVYKQAYWRSNLASFSFFVQ
jgi:hypothetical protein